jgi:anti-anti-sigma regulatory factor
MAPALRKAAAVTAMTLKITEIENKNDAKLLKVEGTLTSGDIGTLEEALDAIEDHQKIAIDLSGVTFIDSDGALVLKRLTSDGVDLKGVDFFIEAVIAANNEGNN